MSFITKKHLPRRTFLQGMGVTLALPLLDSMIPAATAQSKTAALPKSRFCGIYIPHGATMDKWTPATEGGGFAFTETLKPLEKLRDRLVVVSNLAHPMAGGKGSDAGADHARSAAVFLSGAQPQKGTVHGGRTARPGARGPHRPGHAAPVDRGVPRGSGAQLRRRLRLRVLQHHLVAERHAAAADGKQPAGRVRAAVRRRQQRGAAPVAQAAGSQHPRRRHRQGVAPAARARRRRPRAARRVSRQRAGDRAPHPEGDGAVGEQPGRARGPRGRAGSVRRSHQADVRPAGAGLPGGDHAHLDDDVRARYERRGLSRQRRARRLPHRVTPFERAGPHGHLRADQPLPRADARLLPREAEGDARRRRQSARSLGRALRQQHEQRQPARSRPAADPRGRRRVRTVERRPPPRLPGAHADVEPDVVAARQAGRASGSASATAPGSSRF